MEGDFFSLHRYVPTEQSSLRGKERTGKTASQQLQGIACNTTYNRHSKATKLNKTNKRKKEEQEQGDVPTDVGFEPIVGCRKGESTVEPHTLILGTFPSVKSFARNLTDRDISLRGGSGAQVC